MSNIAINWFEIPAKDLARATVFYSNVLGVSFTTMKTPAGEIEAFLNGETPIGALVQGEQSKPSSDGSILYFNTDDIEETLNRVEDEGGTVVLPKTSIGPNGFIGQFLDAEGNRIALHSR